VLLKKERGLVRSLKCCLQLGACLPETRHYGIARGRWR
jgi:hypothetical protein